METRWSLVRWDRDTEEGGLGIKVLEGVGKEGLHVEGGHSPVWQAWQAVT